MAELADLERARKIIARDIEAQENGLRSEGPSIFTCPECGGVLWELYTEGLIRYRCHVGHTYSLEALMADRAGEVEAALWSAARALQEDAFVARRLAARTGQAGQVDISAKYEDRARAAERRARIIEDLLASPIGPVPVLGLAPVESEPEAGEPREQTE